MQTENRLLDDLARVAQGAFGALGGVRDEVEALVRSRLDRVLVDMDLVTREEFEAVKAVAATARSEQEALAKRVGALEARLAALEGQGTDEQKAATRRVRPDSPDEGPARPAESGPG